MCRRPGAGVGQCALENLLFPWELVDANQVLGNEGIAAAGEIPALGTPQAYALFIYYSPIAMQYFRVLAVVLPLLLASAVSAKPPTRNMSVELRVQEEDDAVSPGVVRARQAPAGAIPDQKVHVMNGERAHFEWGDSMPVQWVKSVQTQSVSQSTATGGTLAGQASGIENGLTWLETRQALTVLVAWPGGKQPARLTVEVQTTAQEQQAGQNLPGVSRTRVASTVVVPLGEWFTIAVSGGAVTPEKPGVYSAMPGASGSHKKIQVRVLAP
jgi:hypothetical protein